MALTKESSGQAPRPRDRKRDRDHKQGALEEAHRDGRVRFQRLVNPRSTGGAQGARSFCTQIRTPCGQARRPQTFRGETGAACLGQQGQSLLRACCGETDGDTRGTHPHPGCSSEPGRSRAPGPQAFPRSPGSQTRSVSPGSRDTQVRDAALRRRSPLRWDPASRRNQACAQGFRRSHAPPRCPPGASPGRFRAHSGLHCAPSRNSASRQQPVRGLPGNGGRTPRRAAA